MVFTNIKDGEKGGNLARVLNGALLVSGGSAASSVFQASRLAAYGITPSTPSRTLVLNTDTVASIASGTTSSFWNGAPTAQPYQTAGIAMEVVSNASGAQNTIGGTAAQKLLIDGVDSNGAHQSITIDLAGQTPVAIGNWLDVNFSLVTQVGSQGSNQGTLFIRSVAGSVNQSIMNGLRGTLNQFKYRAPVGRIAFIKKIFFGPRGASGVDTAELLSATLIGFTYRTNGGTAPGPGVQRLTQPFRIFGYRGQGTNVDFGYNFPLFGGDLFIPSVQNTTAFAVRFVGMMIVQEFIL